MIEKPDYVLAFVKPKKTEIKHIRNHWYLYECSSKYDPTTKRSRKISGKCLGVITPNGLQETTRRLKSESQINQEIASRTVIDDVLHVGGPLFLWQRTQQLRERLKKHFPDTWQTVYVEAMLRTEWDVKFKRLQMHYESSLWVKLFPNLSFGPVENEAFLRRLGKQRNAISDFMKEDIESKNVFILFDGHRLISSSKTMEFAELGYDSKRRYKPQVNLMYIFALGVDAQYPMYYKQYIGSTPDVTAFSDILNESAVSEQNCTIVADKGFASDDDFDLLASRNLNYIIPIRRGNVFAKQMYPIHADKFEDVFNYNGRAIHAKKIESEGFNVFIYYDAQLYANELADAVQRGEKQNNSDLKKIELENQRRVKGKGRLSDEELAALQPKALIQIHSDIPEMGTVSIRTNRTELNSMQVYRVYKQRQAIEEFFKTYATTMDCEASYMRDRGKLEAWLFLNHLSSMVCMDCLSDIASAGLDNKISLTDVKESLRKMTAVQMAGKWQLAPIKRSVNSIMEKIGANISNDSLAEVLTSSSSAK